MSKIKSVGKIEASIVLTLTEDEASALYNIAAYGSSEFLKWFYSTLGKHYLKPHEQGLISLFDTVKNELPQHLSKIKKAKEVFNQ